MRKLDGIICDGCRTMFYPGDTIIELCEQCAHHVWCVFNIYEDGTRELSSVHRSEERAQRWIVDNRRILEIGNEDRENKIIEQVISQWFVL